MRDRAGLLSTRRIAALMALLCILGARCAIAEDWVNAGGDGFAALAIDRDSIVAVEGSPVAVGAWFRFRFTTAVRCSPPADCYASGQRNYYHVDCYAGTLVLLRRAFLDLNDNVIAQADFLPYEYMPPALSLDRQGMNAVCMHYRSLNPDAFRFRPYGPSPWPGP
jgi:hypothetical protein